MFFLYLGEAPAGNWMIKEIWVRVFILLTLVPAGHLELPLSCLKVTTPLKVALFITPSPLSFTSPHSSQTQRWKQTLQLMIPGSYTIPLWF